MCTDAHVRVLACKRAHTHRKNTVCPPASIAIAVLLAIQVFRQKDESFVHLLDDVRYGRNARVGVWGGLQDHKITRIRP